MSKPKQSARHGKSGSRPHMPSEIEIRSLLNLYNQQRFPEAERTARYFTQRFPQYAFGWMVLGVVLKQLGRPEEALPVMQKTIELMPGEAEPHNNLGVVLKNLERFAEAETSFRQALQLRPDYPEALTNLGNTLREHGRFTEAETCHRHALKIMPDYAKAHNNLGNLLSTLGNYKEAEAHFRTALSLMPSYADACFNLADTFKEMGRQNDAIALLRKSLQLKPDFHQAHCVLGALLILNGQYEAGMSHLHKSIELKRDFSNALGAIVFNMNYSKHHTPTDLLNAAIEFGKIVSSKTTSPYNQWFCETNAKILRIGLVSGDFNNHPVGAFLENILANINPALLELYAYPTQAKVDSLTDRIRPHFKCWKSLAGLNDRLAAQLIHSDAIHILMDLSGHTEHNRLPVFAYKPAPIQVTWLGYSGTTGLDQINYILGDPYVTPHAEAGHFSENIWQLPESYLCYSEPDIDVDVASLPSITTGQVTFGCFNNLAKVNDHVIAIWSRILHARSNSSLFLRTSQLQDSAVLDSILQRFSTHGIKADRLILDGTYSSRTELFRAYHQVDIALDPFPYNGTTTSAEALWMGVPVLTMRGDRFISHVGESILTNAGLPEWIAADEDDYVAKAVEFTSDLDSLSRLRAGLREQVLSSPLFDAPRFARHFADAMWGMWEKYLQKS
ncbi:MAG TPA: tetratricopeptide repeat protein [Deltaproteobacteria bacterium]|nr:tetratricopeptide repeat protein [Deltaproteobacteria bacterium]